MERRGDREGGREGGRGEGGRERGREGGREGGRQVGDVEGKEHSMYGRMDTYEGLRITDSDQTHLRKQKN